MSKSPSISFGSPPWVQEPELIEANNGHTYVTITKKDIVIMSRSNVNDRQLLPLVTTSSPKAVQWTLKMIVTNKTWVSRDIRRIPYPAEILGALVQHWKINDVCFSAHSRAGSCSMTFNPVPGDTSYNGIMIRLVYGLPFRGTLAIVHDHKANATYAVCFGITPQHSQTFLTRLEAVKDSVCFPLLVAYLLTDIALKNLEQFSSNTYLDFLSVREVMGTNLYFLPAQIVQAPDLAEMPRRLTALGIAAASNYRSLKGFCSIIDTMESHLSSTGMFHGHNSPVICMFADRLMLMRQVVESTLRRNEYLRESVQAQVQMVYALLAQKDNELNHRYGADMRVIAIVTLIFLPGTFVATLFSTSFWDFSPANEGPMVSKWVWMYWVVTAILTISVIGIWMRWPMLAKFRKVKKSMGHGQSEADVEMQKVPAYAQVKTAATIRVHNRRYDESS